MESGKFIFADIIDLYEIHDRYHIAVVIPAKAGIQTINECLHEVGQQPQTRLCPLRGNCLTSWIPAFAGMTM
jgi:hypothetical protein